MKKNDTVFIRTVTNYVIGKIVKIDKQFIELSDASWVADTGRFNTALKDGTLNEVEPYVDNVFVTIGSIVDITKWRHALPREQK
jgi:hypothetical protein